MHLNIQQISGDWWPWQRYVLYRGTYSSMLFCQLSYLPLQVSMSRSPLMCQFLGMLDGCPSFCPDYSSDL